MNTDKVKDTKIVEHKGQKYYRLRDMLIPIDKCSTKDGKTFVNVKAEAKEIKHPDGTQDVIVSVPTLRVIEVSQTKEIGE